jgi:spermidine synthase
MSKKASKKAQGRRGGRVGTDFNPSSRLGILILFSFFLSGGAALVYEVLWLRLITLFSGHTTVATSAVLAAFMGGLALGAFLGGRAADRLPPARLLRLYGMLELSIGITGLLSKPAISILGTLAIDLGVLSFPPVLQSLTYFLLSFVLLLIPTTIMGATLPLLTRWRSLEYTDRQPAPVEPSLASPKNHHTTTRGGADRSLSLLYGLNTLGAVLGTILGGFVLLPSLGLTKSLICAAAVNSLAAFLVLGVGRNSSLGKSHPKAGKATQPVLWRPAVILGLTGAAAMISEVAWTRAFSLILGSTVYAFTVMLATFLLGLASGSLAFHRLYPRKQAEYSGLAILLGGIALSVFIGLPFFDRLPYLFLRLHDFAFLKTDLVYLVQFAFCALVMIVPTFLMGAVLPWAVAVACPERASIGRHTGAYYAANTTGAIIGSATAGLILLPMVDVDRSLMMAVWIYAGAGLVAFGGMAGAWNGWSRIRYAALPVILLVMGTWFRPALSQRILTSGMFLYSAHYSSVKDYSGFTREMARDNVLFHRSGRNATVTVLETATGSRYMRINGKTDASESKDMGTQLLLGYLPLLLHPAQPRKALVVGLGSGVTPAVLASDPLLQRIDVVEIEPMVAEGARLFSRANRNVLEDPRLQLHFADARQWIASKGDPYDVIISEPSNPWIAGIASLYTREAFESVKGRLARDGIFCQWFHSYYMSVEDFKMVLRTFTSVFPHTMLMYYNQGDYFLMGSRTPWRIDYRKIERAFAGNRNLRQDLFPLEPVIDHPLRLLGWTFALTDADLRKYAAGSRVHTDDHPTLEFTAPRHFHKKQAGVILEELRKYKSRWVPDGLVGLKDTNREKAVLMDLAGQSLLLTNNLEGAEGAFKKALHLDPKSARTWTHNALLLERRGDKERALQAYQKAVLLDPQYWEGRRQLGRFYSLQGRLEEGAVELLEALNLIPADPQASLDLARIYEALGRRFEAAKIVRAALQKSIHDEDIRASLETVLRHAETHVNSSSNGS